MGMVKTAFKPKKGKKYKKFHNSPAAAGMAQARAFIELSKLNADNQLLGPGPAARKRKAVRETGHTNADMYRTEGAFAHFQREGKKKATGMKLRKKRGK